MKYRRLTRAELSELEKEFVGFLASNTVTGDDWEKLKIEDPEKVNGLIDIFSDIVFEQTIKKLEYLELKTSKDFKIFHCKKEEIELMGLLIEGEAPLDFTQNTAPEAMMQILQASEAELKLYSAKKKYKGNREEEIFQMMQWGSLISDGKMFHILKELQPET